MANGSGNNLVGAVDSFTGLAGVFRQWAGLGIVAMDCLFLGLAIFWLIPEQQRRFDVMLHIEREARNKEFSMISQQWRMEREAEQERSRLWQELSRERDSRLTKSIEDNQKILAELGRDLAVNQKTIQAMLIDLRDVKVKSKP